MSSIAINSPGNKGKATYNRKRLKKLVERIEAPGERIKILTKRASLEVVSKTPELAKELKYYVSRYPDAVPIVLIAGGAVAVVIGNKMVIAGTTVTVASIVISVGALIAGHPEIALLAAHAAALGLKATILGLIIKLVGIAACGAGVVIGAIRVYKRVKSWWANNRERVEYLWRRLRWRFSDGGAAPCLLGA